MTYNHKNLKGFTLIETLVAILLLATAIAGPLTIASKGLTSALVAKDQIVAQFLAQDAIEYIRYRRDTNCLGTAPAPCAQNVWLAGLSQCISADGSAACIIDSTHNSPSSGVSNCSSATTCPSIRHHAATGRFTYDVGGTLTIFTRTVTIVTPYGGSTSCSPAGGCEALVTVEVEWSDMADLTRRVVEKEHLLNWQ